MPSVRQLTTNRVQSCSHGLPRCEGRKPKVKVKTAKAGLNGVNEHELSRIYTNYQGTMKRMGESQLQRIIRKTGRKPIQCKCKLCQQQCHTPCLGTPQDILKLIKAGYADRLSWTDWAAGIIMGCTDHVVGMVQATADGDWCTFYHDGLCELHDKGLKPTEGRLSHHSMRLDNWTPKKSISWNVAKEWEDEDNAPVLQEIYDELKKAKGL